MIGENAMTMHELIAESNAVLSEMLTCNFGIPYLDDALLGMGPGEVTLLGAKSGGGKTEAATQIVLAQQDHEKKKAKSVLYFALDHEKGEIEKRVLWRLIVDQVKFCRDPKFNGVALRYAGWRKGAYRDLIRDYEKDAATYLRHLLALSETKFLYRKGELAAEHVAEIISGSAQQFNLYVVDHFHSLLGLDRIEAQSEAITLISQAAEKADRPVLILGQFRKNSAVTSNCPLPTMEDFSGSSQLVYQPNNIVVMAPKPSDGDKYETYFHVVKARSASDAKPFVGVHSFDIELKRYSENYQVCRFNPFKEPEPVTGEAIPKWAVRAHGLSQTIERARNKSWIQG